MCIRDRYDFVDTADVEDVFQTRESITYKKVKLEQLGMKAEEKIIYIPEMESVLIIYQDITKEEKAKEKHYNPVSYTHLYILETEIEIRGETR